MVESWCFPASAKFATIITSIMFITFIIFITFNTFTNFNTFAIPERTKW